MKNPASATSHVVMLMASTRYRLASRVDVGDRPATTHNTTVQRTRHTAHGPPTGIARDRKQQRARNPRTVTSTPSPHQCLCEGMLQAKVS